MLAGHTPGAAGSFVKYSDATSQALLAVFDICRTEMVDSEYIYWYFEWFYVYFSMIPASLCE